MCAQLWFAQGVCWGGHKGTDIHTYQEVARCAHPGAVSLACELEEVSASETVPPHSIYQPPWLKDVTGPM